MIGEQIKYRHEMKYLISNAQLGTIRNQLEHLMNVDKNANAAGAYNIRSIYFDDYNNSCFYENENGTSPREKFRIRIYNHSLDRISLECKRKENGKIHKTSCLLNIDDAKTLISGQYMRNIGEQSELLKKLTYLMMTRGYKPVVIVEYDRIPYVYRTGNVRITLDRGISTSSDLSHFFEKDIPKRPIMQTGQQLLEVKYDELIPDHIYNSLQLDHLRQITFSKYYLCRKISM